MALDGTKIGTVAAALMEYLDRDLEDEPSAELGEVLILAEIRGCDEDGEQWTYMQFRCSDRRDWVQRGMMHAALDAQRVTDLPEDPDDT